MSCLLSFLREVRTSVLFHWTLLPWDDIHINGAAGDSGGSLRMKKSTGRNQTQEIGNKWVQIDSSEFLDSTLPEDSSTLELLESRYYYVYK